MNVTVKAVIFDLNGTILDTEKYYRENWPKTMAFFGQEMSDETALDIRSMGKPFASKLFRQWYGKEFDFDVAMVHQRQLVDQCIENNGLAVKEGAKEVLAYLKAKGIKTAVATANDLERAEKYLKLAGLRGYFADVFCADMVEQGKPAPNLYQYACEQLGVAPGECLVLENSLNGVTGAFLAGCNTVFIPDQTPVDEKIRPLTVACLESLEGLKELV